jgi:hypothetical protein
VSLWRKRQVKENNGENKRIRNLPVPDTGMGGAAVLSSQSEHQPTNETQHLHSSGDQPRRNTTGAGTLPHDKGA